MGKIEVVGILINILWLILLAAVLDTYHRQLRIINTEEALESLMSILDRWLFLIVSIFMIRGTTKSYGGIHAALGLFKEGK